MKTSPLEAKHEYLIDKNNDCLPLMNRHDRMIYTVLITITFERICQYGFKSIIKSTMKWFKCENDEANVYYHLFCSMIPLSSVFFSYIADHIHYFLLIYTIFFLYTLGFVLGLSSMFMEKVFLLKISLIFCAMGSGGSAMTLASFGRSITDDTSFFFTMGYFANVGAFIGMLYFTMLSNQTLFFWAYTNFIIASCCMALVYSSGLKYFCSELERRKPKRFIARKQASDVEKLPSRLRIQTENAVLSPQAIDPQDKAPLSKEACLLHRTNHLKVSDETQFNEQNTGRPNIPQCSIENMSGNEFDRNPTEKGGPILESGIHFGHSKEITSKEPSDQPHFEHVSPSYARTKTESKELAIDEQISSFIPISPDGSDTYDQGNKKIQNKHIAHSSVSDIQYVNENVNRHDNKHIDKNKDQKINIPDQLVIISDITNESRIDDNIEQNNNPENNSFPLIVLILLPLLAYFILRDQYLSTWCDQAEGLKPTFFLKAHQLPLFYPIFIFILTPYLSKIRMKITHKLILGYFFGVLSYFACFVIEYTKGPVTIQLIPYFLLSSAEILCYTVSHEYSYLVAPQSKRFFTISMLRLCSFTGNLFVSIINGMEILSSLRGAFFLWFSLAFVGLIFQTIFLLAFDKKLCKRKKK